MRDFQAMHWLSSPTLAVCTFESVPCTCTLMSCNALVHCPSDPAVALTLALHWSTAPPLRPAQGTRTGKLAARIGWNRPDAKLWLPSGVKQGVQGRPLPPLARSTMELSSSGPCPAPLAPFTTTSLHSRLEMAVDQRQSSWSELIEGRQNILSHLTFSLLSRLKMAPNSYHQGKKTLKGK